MNQAELDLLVLTAQDGNQQAFGLLFKFYHKALIAFAIKLGKNRELAKDAVQDAWVKAAKNIRKLQDPRAFKSWIYRLVRWKVIDLLRKLSRDDKRLEELNEETASTLVENQIEVDETLSTALSRLPDSDKQILHLLYLDEMKVREISVVLEIPIGTVKSRLNRARKLLKEKYQQLEN